ncbi:MAG TPA: FtsX-like permease family protein [Thermoanaerobaculia bacterium]|jgi:putative ABC transport system permease protein
MKFAKLIRRNLFRNKMRAFLTLALMAAIFFFVALLLSILENFEMFSDAGATTNRLGVQSAVGLAESLPLAHEAKIRAIPGVVDVAKLQWFGGYYKEQSNFFANFAIDHDRMATVYDDYVMPDDQRQAFINDRQGAVVGPELMKRFGWKIGQRITLTGAIFPFNPELNIRAVYTHPIDSSSLFFHNDYFQQSMANFNRTGMYWLKVRDRNQMDAISRQIDDMFKNSDAPTETYTEKEFQLQFMAMMGNIKLLFTAISVCSMFMVVLLAGITMSMSARERVTEIAVLKAIGYPARLLLALMLTEFALLTMVGAAIGVFGGKLLMSTLPITAMTAGFLVNFDFYPKVIVICLAASALVGLIAGGWPALRAANMSVVNGLRRVV